MSGEVKGEQTWAPAKVAPVVDYEATRCVNVDSALNDCGPVANLLVDSSLHLG